MHLSGLCALQFTPNPVLLMGCGDLAGLGKEATEIAEHSRFCFGSRQGVVLHVCSLLVAGQRRG